MTFSLLRTIVSPLVLLIAFCLTGLRPSAAQPVLTASFDWRVPDRLRVDDLGRVEIFTDYDEINPNAWPVHFDACASAGSITYYDWEVNGESVGGSETCDGFSYGFPAEGIYQVELTVQGNDGTSSATSGQDVNVRDFLIIGMGDSYASGEGNPDVPIPPDAWVDLASAVDDLVGAVQNRDAARLDLTSAQEAVAAALEDYQAAVDALNAIRDDLNDLLADIAVMHQYDLEVQAAMSAVDAARAYRNAVCPFPVRGCASAQAALTTRQAELAAARLALAAEVGRRGFETLASLRTHWDSLRNSLEQDRSVREQAQSIAETILGNARERVERASALLALLQNTVTALRATIEQATSDVHPVWGTTDEDRLCHRSSASGQVQAALKLERSDPKTSVTFIHLACSGATIVNGLIGYYSGIEGESRSIEPQVVAASTLAGAREIDAIVISIGGNDIKFSGIVETCMAEEPCFDPVDDAAYEAARESAVREMCEMLPGLLPLDDLPVRTPYEICVARLLTADPPSESASELFDEAFSRLDDLYGDLNAEIEGWLPDLPADRVYITQYPDLTKDETGNYCGFDPTADAAAQLMQLPGITNSELAWADSGPLSELNDAIVEAAMTHGWNVVDGIYEAFGRHGYCSTDGWVVRLPQSLAQQNDILGTVHPTRAGHYVYRDQIYEALAGDLYSVDPENPGALPATPINASPEDGSMVVETQTLLAWNGATGAASYDLQVSTGADFAAMIVDEAGLRDTTFDVSGLEAGATYYWRVRGVNGAGASAYSAVSSFTTATSVAVMDAQGVPTDFELLPNYPNPFNPQTTIRYALPKSTHVTLSVYDMLGREVKRLVDRRQGVGRHEVVFEAADLGTGVYVYQLRAGAFVQTRPMMLLK